MMEDIRSIDKVFDSLFLRAEARSAISYGLGIKGIDESKGTFFEQERGEHILIGWRENVNEER